ncbi:MAG TPA: HupE/UreJ family protein [Polyangiaceae bacterium]|jgi:urease accessory protein|nr:HupE/UreJ family protein [Polyangiaceae bacterium]
MDPISRRSTRVRPAVTAALAALAVYAPPAVAHAHHGMGGKLPASLWQGLLAGLAHPVIGVDHLAMLLLVGAYCGAARQGRRPLLAFVVAALVGCLLHVARLDLPHVEATIAASLVVSGLVACAALRSSPAVTTAVLGAVGVLHGYAYGESIVGAEPTPLAGYLLGLTLVQGALAGLLLRLTAHAASGPEPRGLRVTRVLGAASALVGLVALFAFWVERV